METSLVTSLVNIDQTTDFSKKNNDQNNPIENKVTSKKNEFVPFKKFDAFIVLLNPNVKRFIDVLNSKAS